MTIVEDALALVDEAAVAELTMEMVDIPSPMGGEKRLADYLANRFAAAGPADESPGGRNRTGSTFTGSWKGQAVDRR